MDNVILAAEIPFVARLLSVTGELDLASGLAEHAGADASLEAWNVDDRVRLERALRSARRSGSYDTYWSSVFGDHRDADRVVMEFGLVGTDGLDEWLGEAEAEAARQTGWRDEVLALWAQHHQRALAELSEALNG